MSENLEKEVDIFSDNVRDKKVLETILKFAEPSKNKSLIEDKSVVEYIEPPVTKKTRIAFLMMPQWSCTYPPYNMARLSAITEHAGYKTIAFDVNIACYQATRSWENFIHFDPWNHSYMTKWFSPEYQQYIHPHIKSTLDDYIEKVIKFNPTAVAFTLYDSNRESLLYFHGELKKRLPNVISLIGGPICNKGDPRLGPEWDYISQGEGEKLILEILEDVELNGKPETTKKYVQQIGERINLDELPLPNWNFYDFSQYQVPNGATLEFSRGCVAKCVFCDETHFWKFRGRASDRVLEEVTDLYNRGVNTFWFVDSLLNGNLKELRNFANKIVERKMKIRWIGYSRCDERMDLEYFKDIAASGCMGFAFGVESGSDKVLQDMQKGITSEEVYNNFRDSSAVGLESGIMLIVGFPTEKNEDFYQTLELLWRVRNFNLSFVACGFTLQLTPETVMGQDGESYGVIPGYYGNNWITKNFDNSKLHRLIRLKLVHIFLENVPSESGKKYNMRPNVITHYNVKYEDDNIVNSLLPERDFDFNIVKLDTENNLANTIINEAWPIFRLLYRARGAFEMTINFEEEMDRKEFQPQLTERFNGVFQFKINSQGEWEADFRLKYEQPENSWQYSDHTGVKDSIALQRIRTLLEGKRKKLQIYNGVVPQEPRETYDSFNAKYKHLDLSFDINYRGSGKW